jgi:hypothetical protein
VQFAKRFLHEVAPAVEVLDVARNDLANLGCVAAFGRLGQLDASSNVLASMDALAPALALPYLSSVRFEGNPVCRTLSKYRDEVILLGSILVNLDGREIKPHERQFLHELDRRRRSAARSARRRDRSGSRGPRGPSAPADLRRGHSGVECAGAAPCGINGGYAGGSQSRLPPIPPGGSANNRTGASPGSQAAGSQCASRRQRSHDRLSK